MRRAIVALSLLPLAACASSLTPSTATQAAHTPLRVVVLGNSISLGYYATGWERIQLDAAGRLTPESQADDSGGGAVQQLSRYLRGRGDTLVNESINGGTTPRMSPRMDAIVAATPRYDLALLPLEVNDANQGFSVAAFTFQMHYMVDRLTAAGIRPVLVKENDIWDLPAQRFGTPIADFMTAVDQIAAERGLSVIDAYTPFHAAVLAGGGIVTCGLFHGPDDGIHPNQAGHDLLFAVYRQWFETAK